MPPRVSPADGNVTIGSLKGVMLCNRPCGNENRNAATTLPIENEKRTDRFAFVAGVPAEPIGYNVPIHAESTVRVTCVCGYWLKYSDSTESNAIRVIRRWRNIGNGCLNFSRSVIVLEICWKKMKKNVSDVKNCTLSLVEWSGILILVQVLAA